jgi:hypothetical protein
MSAVGSEEHVASNFRVEERAKKETNMALLAIFFTSVSCLAYSSTL